MTRPSSTLRVGIATSGRFHLLDLARELDGLGVDVQFYSYVPQKRAEKFGLPGRCHVALLPFLFPLVAMERLYHASAASSTPHPASLRYPHPTRLSLMKESFRDRKNAFSYTMNIKMLAVPARSYS